MEERKPKFTFRLSEGKKFSTLEDKDNKELLKKWSMQGNLIAQMYTFDQAFQVYQKEEFVLDLMRDPNVLSTLLVASRDGTPRMLKSVPCSVLSMTFFDRLYGPIVRDSGHLIKCFDEFFEDFTISDELRKMFLSEESDHCDLYSDTEKEEFLFRLFMHVCLGGQICQYEDTLEPYLNLDKDDDVFYPSSKSHIQNFSYLVVDPLKRHVIVLSHQFGGGIFS
ncbi:CF300-like protein [Mya arenaria]|uniref:Cilia- and flagella-associated protein 300 n=1 Tax=Mya arenaria TaxID=6604 RepID=A0ABY7G6M0_MYAAR|nr:CF300-like protein [Mya arenaria]